MNVIKQKITCHACEKTAIIAFESKVADEADHCPFCGIALDNFEDDDGEDGE